MVGLVMSCKKSLAGGGGVQGNWTCYCFAASTWSGITSTSSICSSSSVAWLFVSGEGMFGKVYTAVNMDTGGYMAMKEVSDDGDWFIDLLIDLDEDDD